MKNLRKSMSVILILLIALFSFSTVAFASTTEQDGLKVELTTDKENYSLNEDIKINVTVTNTNDVIIENVKIDTLLPEEFILKDDSQSTSSEAVDIPAGEKIELSVTAVVKDGKTDTPSSDTDSSLTQKPDNNDSKVQAVQVTDNKSDTNKKDTANKINGNDKSPYTGKDYAVMTGFSALFVIGIVLLILSLKRNTKKTTKAVSSALCLVLAVTSIIGLVDFKAKAENKQSDTDSPVVETNTDTSFVISISENISVDGKDYTIEANVSYNIETNKKNKKDIKEMSEVDNAINDLLNSDSYKNIVNNEEKVKVVEDLLIDLSRNGTDKMSKPLIQEDTITYYKETNQFGFIYSCGVSGGIYLNNFNNMIASNGLKSENLTNIENEISNNTRNNAVLMYGWDNSSEQDSLFNEWNDYALDISNRGLKTKVYNCPSILDYKTAFLEMDFICICEHGGFDSQTNTYCFLVQGEKYSILKEMNYILDIYEDNILRRNINGSNAYLITPKFFQFYYNGKLNGAIVILGSCKGFGANGVYDYSFAKAFYNECGADVILGYHNDVYLAYDLVIAEDFTKNLLFGYTAKDARKLALWKNGNCDNDYMYKYMPNINPTWWNNPDEKNNMKTGKEQVDEKVAAIPILYGDKEKKLKLNRGNVCGIVKDSTTNNPIKDVKVEVIDNSSDSYDPVVTTTTDKNGNFNLNLPYDEYSISFNHYDYNYYGTSITIDCETVVLTEPVLLKKIEKTLTETDLKKAIEKKSKSKIAEWIYEDFDGNGTKEAFAIVGSKEYVENKNTFVYVWFINDKGEITHMKREFWDGQKKFSYCGYYSNVEVFKQGKKRFFSFTSSNEAPARGFIFGVVNGKAHEFDVSGEYIGFTYENDIIYANGNTTNEGGLVSVKYELTYDDKTNEFIVSDSNLNSENSFAGNQTVEQLKKSIVGSWGRAGSVDSEYDFNNDNTCYWQSQTQKPGTYKISGDKTLVVTFPWTTNKYTWSDETFDEFHSHSKGYFWYLTDNGILVLNGSDYYKNGKVIVEYNTQGNLLSTIAGTWISDNGFSEYRFFSDGTYEENNVIISGGNFIISRTNIEKGTIDIIDDTTAKLWRDLPEGYGYIPSGPELTYDAKSDKIYIGGSQNSFSKAKY